MVIVSAFQHAVLAGALIALALVRPLPGGRGPGGREIVMTLEALRRVGLDVLLMVGLELRSCCSSSVSSTATVSP